MNDQREKEAVRKIITGMSERPADVVHLPRLAGGFKIKVRASTAKLNSYLSLVMFCGFLAVPAILIWGEDPWRIPAGVGAAALWFGARLIRIRFPSAYKIKTKAYGLKFTTQNGVQSVRQRMVIENGIDLDFGYELKDSSWSREPEIVQLWLNIREEGMHQKWGEKADWEEVAWVYAYLSENLSEANFMATLTVDVPGEDGMNEEEPDAEEVASVTPPPASPSGDPDYDWHKANL